jgi:hypothetical protein
MMEPTDDIIVFRQFDNSIEANIVKTKLDAYGIPCFLSEENLAGLYPGQHFNLFSIRLHLFAKDAEQVQQILDESNLVLDNDSITCCPQCKSIKVARDFPKRLSERISSSLAVLFFGVFFPKYKIFRCLDCDHEF